MRRFLIHLLPFLVPFVLYALWLTAQRRRAANREDAPSWERAPWAPLTAIGMALVFLSLLGLAFLGREGGGRYVPAHYENGEVVPGRMAPPAVPGESG